MTIHPLSRLLFVAYFLEVGLVLIVAPWSAFWDRNFFAAWLPQLHSIVTDNFTRGAVSGLGLVNVWAALAELAALFGRWRDRAALSRSEI